MAKKKLETQYAFSSGGPDAAELIARSFEAYIAARTGAGL